MILIFLLFIFSGKKRWCRTYFLQRGKAIPLVKNIDSLVDSEQHHPQLSLSESKMANNATTTGMIDDVAVMIPTHVTTSLQRLESLYSKLYIYMRRIVKVAFATHCDVLEAGTYLQRKMNLAMSGQSLVETSDSAEVTQALTAVFASSMYDLDSVKLLPVTEYLTVHMDCMNAMGKVVSVEDVDDMNGNVSTIATK